MDSFSLVSVLLQAPTRGGDFLGDTFSGFLGQIPLVLILQVCVTGTLLVIALVYFVNRRRRRAAAKLAQAQQEAAAAMASVMPPPPAPAVSNRDMDDMPDLDMLVGGSALTYDEPEAFSPEPPPLSSAPPTRMSPPGVYAVTLHTGQTTEVEEVLSILRDRVDGRLIVQIEDTAYRTLLDTPDAKKLFTQIMRELSEVVTRPDERMAEAPLVPADEPEAPPVATPPVATPEPPPSPVETPQPAAPKSPPPPPMPGGVMPGDLPSYKLEDHPVEVKSGRLGGKRYESGPIPEFDIASAIESYLQHKLAHTPEYAGRDIHILSAPGGGVRIQIDERFYDAVDDVDDLAIRAFLQEAIQEWQDRQ